jgi:hypothetical protein
VGAVEFNADATDRCGGMVEISRPDVARLVEQAGAPTASSVFSVT